MNKIPRISETEWQVMRVVWAKHPIKASDIVDELVAQDPEWHPKTVRSLLTRLVDKGALSFGEKGRSYLYVPCVKEEDCVAEASGSFLDRVFGGSVKPLLMHFLEQKKLSESELAELRAILDESTEAKKTAAKRKGGNS